jgi:hypothetical protein
MSWEATRTSCCSALTRKGSTGSGRVYGLLHAANAVLFDAATVGVFTTEKQQRFRSLIWNSATLCLILYRFFTSVISVTTEFFLALLSKWRWLGHSWWKFNFANADSPDAWLLRNVVNVSLCEMLTVSTVWVSNFSLEIELCYINIPDLNAHNETWIIFPHLLHHKFFVIMNRLIEGFYLVFVVTL